MAQAHRPVVPTPPRYRPPYQPQMCPHSAGVVVPRRERGKLHPASAPVWQVSPVRKAQQNVRQVCAELWRVAPVRLPVSQFPMSPLKKAYLRKAHLSAGLHLPGAEHRPGHGLVQVETAHPPSQVNAGSPRHPAMLRSLRVRRTQICPLAVCPTAVYRPMMDW